MNLTYTILLNVKWYFVLLHFVLVLFSNVYRNWGGFHDSGYLLTLMEVSSTRIVNEMNNISCTFLWSNKYISLSLSTPMKVGKVYKYKLSILFEAVNSISRLYRSIQWAGEASSKSFTSMSVIWSEMDSNNP